ncbi:hypothetical protein ACFSLT_31390 [Novosphingobium resinovorum]
MLVKADGLSTRAVRDRAILVLGLAAALRRSELVALQLADIQLVEQGLTVFVRHSKTDQEGEGLPSPCLSRQGPETCRASQRLAGH